MKIEERIKALQEITQDYIKTSELLDVSYDQVRSVCEEDE